MQCIKPYCLGGGQAAQKRMFASGGAIDTAMRGEAERLQEAVLDWDRRRAWRSFLTASILLATVYPLAAFLWAPTNSEPLQLRLIFAAGAAALCIVGLAFPRLRRHARFFMLAELVAFFLIQGAYVAKAGFSSSIVLREVIVIYATPLIAPAVIDIAVCYAAMLLAALLLAQNVSLSNPSDAAFGTLLLSCIVGLVVGGVTIESRRREIRTRLSTELQKEEQLSVLRTRDRVSGLPNFERFVDLCEDAIDSSYVRGTGFAVILIDLDRFSYTVHEHGNRIADAIIAEVARRFETTITEAVVGRGRTDTFLVLCTDAHKDEAKETAYELLDSLAKPFTPGGKTIYVTATAGIAAYPADGTRVEDLLRRCNDAVRHARGGTADVAAMASGEAEGEYSRMRELRDDLRHALSRKEFQLYYQPCVDSRSGEVLTAEALLRWKHPTKGLLLPSEFVPLLEAEQLITNVGEWVLREAVSACARWGRHIGVSINVSLHQFGDASLPERVRSALADANLGPNALTLELTESVAMQNAEYTLRTMRSCKELGVQFALDDFGTGYSSLAHLKELPIDSIKIDRGFVRGLPASDGDTAIIRSMIQLARSLRCTVYAEGVERLEQAQWLAIEGCHALQGFAIAGPMDAQAFVSWLAAYTPQPPSLPKVS